MNSTIEILPKLAYSIPEFCDIASIGRSKVYEEIKSGNIIVRKFGKRTLILADEGRNYLESLPILVANNE